MDADGAAPRHAEIPLVAIVDDDPGVRRALARLVRSFGFRTRVYATGEAFLEVAESEPPDRVLLDLHLPGLRGPDLITALAERGVAPDRIVVMTGFDRPGMREACLRSGAAAYVTKPIHPEDIEAILGAPGVP